MSDLKTNAPLPTPNTRSGGRQACTPAQIHPSLPLPPQQDVRDRTENKSALKDLPTEELTAVREVLLGTLRSRGHSPEDAEDLTHDAFVKLLLNDGIRSPVAWLNIVAVRDGRTLDRRKRCEERALKWRLQQKRVSDCDDALTDREMLKIHIAICQLDGISCRIVKLWLDGKRFVKIGTALGISEGAARYRFAKARKQLRCLLEVAE